MPIRITESNVPLDGLLLDGLPLNEGKGADVASAATTNIWSGTGNLVPITGTAAIAAFSAAPQPGAKRTLLCVNTPTFIHSANFLLPGSVNYTAAAGDRIEVIAITTTQFRLSVLKASVLADVYVAEYPGNDFGQRFNAAVAIHGRQNIRYVCNSGVHTLTTPVDLTLMTNVEVDLRGSDITVIGPIVGFDMTDTEVMFYFGYIRGDATNIPLCGVLHAQATMPDHERGCVIGDTITGKWQYAPVVHNGRERHKFSGYFDNYHNQGYCFAITRDGKIRIGGVLLTLVSPYRGSIISSSPTKTWIHQSTFFSVGAAGDGIIFLRGDCAQTTIDTFEVRSRGEAIFVIDDDVGRGFNFLNFNTRIGNNLGIPEVNVAACDFIKLNQPTSTIKGLRVTGFIRLLQDSAVGTPGYMVNMTGSSGTLTEAIIDNQESLSYNSGILIAGRAVKNVKANVLLADITAVYSDVAIYGHCEIEGAKATVYIYANTDVRATGQGLVTVASGVGIRGTENQNGTIISGFNVTTANGNAVHIPQNNSIFRGTKVLSATGGEGFNVGGQKNRLDGCSVDTVVTAGKYALAFGPSSATLKASYNTVTGGVFVGNVRFGTDGAGNNATGNTLVGVYIQGNVTFEAGTDFNKLIGCTVTGTITNLGGANNVSI